MGKTCDRNLVNLVNLDYGTISYLVAGPPTKPLLCVLLFLIVERRTNKAAHLTNHTTPRKSQGRNSANLDTIPLLTNIQVNTNIIFRTDDAQFFLIKQLKN